MSNDVIKISEVKLKNLSGQLSKNLQNFQWILTGPNILFKYEIEFSLKD
jgi:hypothetical protein